MKTIESRIAPNPMEAKIWVDLNENPHGLVKKYWNGTQWVTKNNNEVSKEEILKTLEPQIKEVKDAFLNVKKDIESMNEHHDEYLLKLIKDLVIRVSKLEQFIITE